MKLEEKINLSNINQSFSLELTRMKRVALINPFVLLDEYSYLNFDIKELQEIKELILVNLYKLREGVEKGEFSSGQLENIIRTLTHKVSKLSPQEIAEYIHHVIEYSDSKLCALENNDSFELA